jgi:hypothetical protein
MNRSFAIVACIAMASTTLVTPAMATTDSGAYGKHQLDCLGLLFGDPKVHESECGPFNAPPFWFPTGGSGAACPTTAELSPSQIVRGIPGRDGHAYDVALRLPCDPGCPIGYLVPQAPQLLDVIAEGRWPVFSDGYLVAVC